MKRTLLALSLLVISCTHSTSKVDRELAAAPRAEVEAPAFIMTAKCAVTCDNGAEKIVTSNPETFEPTNTSLTVANGNFVPTLTLRISNQADSMCLKTAIQTCVSANQVKKIESKSVSSRSWTAKLPLDCSPSRGCAVSPYEKLKNLEPVAGKTFFSDSDLPMSFREKSEEPGDCKHAVSFESCFGDCMSDHESCSIEKKFVQTLMSPEPGARDQVKVCMDHFDVKIQKEKPTKSVRSIMCRIFARQSVLDQQLGEIRCAAFRINTDPCDSY